VQPERVFEIAFEGIGPSSRHKSGIATRFPRISRARPDKGLDDIDTLETARALIP
jgi:DNA ligase-1